MEWIELLDKFRKSLLDEQLIISIKGKFDPHYVENMPRLDRKYVLEELMKLIEAENKAVTKDEEKFKFQKP